MAASMVGAAVAPTSAATSAARAGSASAMTTPSTPGVAASSRPWRRPIRPAPSSATFIVHPRSRCVRVATEPSQRRGQDPPPDRRALRRRTPAAVLLDHQPAVVVAAGGSGEDAVEVEHACPELGEEARPDRGIEATDRSAAQTVEDIGVDVLEMDVRHLIAEFAQRRDRVAAADGVVADVEADADQLGIEAGGQSLDLGRRLDERPAVGMEGRPMSGRRRPPPQGRGSSRGARPSRRRSAPGCRARPPGRRVPRDRATVRGR